MANECSGAVRLVFGVLVLVLESMSKPSIGLFIAATIVASVGLTLLLMTSLGFMRTVYAANEPPARARCGLANGAMHTGPAPRSRTRRVSPGFWIGRRAFWFLPLYSRWRVAPCASRQTSYRRRKRAGS